MPDDRTDRADPEMEKALAREQPILSDPFKQRVAFNVGFKAGWQAKARVLAGQQEEEAEKLRLQQDAEGLAKRHEAKPGSALEPSPAASPELAPYGTLSGSNPEPEGKGHE